MMRNIWSRFQNAIGVIALTVVIVLIGYVEIAHPFGLEFADFTGGIVTIDTMIRIGIITILVEGLNLLKGYA